MSWQVAAGCSACIFHPPSTLAPPHQPTTARARHMQVRTFIKHLWMPALVVGIFAVASAYQQEIFLQLGLTTWKQMRLVLPYTIQIGIWLSLAYLVTRIADVTIWDQVARQVPVPKLLRDVTKGLIYCIALSAIVGVVFKRPVGAFWAASGAAGIVIGLALRGVIVDLFMGLAMNFDRPFEIGHFINVVNGLNSVSGRVVELNWRTTRIITSEGNLVVIPNGKLGELTVMNFSRPDPTSEMEFIVSLDSTVPAERALRVLTAGAMSVAGTNGVLEEPAPKARIKGFTGVGVDYKIKYSIDPRLGGPGKARHAIMRAVLEQLHHAGLHLAVNKQEMITGREHAPHHDPSSIADRATLLARTELFRNLDLTAREHLAVHMQERVVAAGEAVIREGEAGDSMYVIFEGLLFAHVPSHDRQSSVRVGKLDAGSFFGEISALTGEPRSATVTAACDSLIFEIRKEAFASLVATRPDVLHTLSDAIVARRSRTADALAKADAAGVAAEARSFGRQLIDRMMGFFRLGSYGEPGHAPRNTPPRSFAAVPDSAEPMPVAVPPQVLPPEIPGPRAPTLTRH
jgi:small-conductance mechanosensitive channel/CRP-like cAMP-binding protein